jgi:fructosamine-3-kinase
VRGGGGAQDPVGGSWPTWLAAVVRTAPLHGGDIGEVVRAELADGRTVVVKSTSYDADLEAEGLHALAEAGAPVPAVLDVQPHRLILEHVSGPADWATLGRSLAQVHRHTAERFGWHRDNVIGPLRQRNGWRDRWPEFHVEQRLAPYLGDLPSDLAARLERAMTGPLPRLLDHDAPASLVHGDLWTGNVVAGRWLIDPAVHHADREVDLAMLTLFGDAPAALHRAYAEAWPLDPGWERRRPALQLAPLLVHVRLFGGGYIASVARRLDAIGC